MVNEVYHYIFIPKTTQSGYDMKNYLNTNIINNFLKTNDHKYISSITNITQVKVFKNISVENC